MNQYAPIALFVYNRPKHTEQVISAIMDCKDFDNSILYIFSDGPKTSEDEKNVSLVRAYLDSIKKNNVILKFKNENQGLANSIISGSTYILDRYKKIIVLEDDLIVTKYFICFMNRCLDFYEENRQVWSATGFTFPRKFLGITDDRKIIYFHYRPMSWTWATWKNRWEQVDWEVKDFLTLKLDKTRFSNFTRGGKDLYRMLSNQMSGKIDSWYIRWCYEASKQNCLTVYPHTSFVKNIGHDFSMDS